MKKKVAFFIDSLGCGGAEKSLISLLGLLDYDKIDVDLYTWHRGGELMQFKPDQVRSCLFPTPIGVMKAFHRIGQVNYSIWLRCIRRFGMKIHLAEPFWRAIHRTLPKIDKHYDVAVAYQQGFPTYFVADKVDADVKIGWINSDMRKADHREKFSRRYYDKFDYAVAVSDRVYKDQAMWRYVDSSKLVQIFDIIDVKLIGKMAADPMSLADHIKDKVNIVTVARLSKPKNYPLAVATAKILKSRGLDFVWTFVGGGIEYQNIKDLIDTYEVNDCVRMVGSQVNPYPFMKNADIYVQTSSFEGFGLTIAEAKILGKPVVSTNFRVVYDQITDGVNGLIAEMTPESVADKIINLVSDDELRHNIVDNIHKETNTTSETEIRKFYQLIGLD